MSTPSRSDPPAPRANSASGRLYWHGRADRQGKWLEDSVTKTPRRPPGEDLAALRAGLGRQAFTEPRLWPYYRTPTDGIVTRELQAEHAALTLYGLHQQSQSISMHRPGVRTGKALRALHERFGEEAVDRRVAATVGSTTVTAFVHRLRGLVTQLRSIQQPLDYDRLMQDIVRWHFPDGRSQVRRQWGLAFHTSATRTDAD